MWKKIFYIIAVLSFLITNIYANTDNKLDNCPFPILKKLYDKYSQSTKKVSNWWYEDSSNWYLETDTKKENKYDCNIDNLSFLSPKLLRTLPVPQFKKLMDELQEFSISYPTKKNIEIYMIAQWIANERAKNYMQSWHNVIIAHPALDYTVVRPPHSYATMRQVLYISDTTNNFLHSLAKRDDVALIAFVSPNCVYCASEMPILNNMVSEYGIRLKYINTLKRPDLLAKFGIEAVPEVWLAVRGKGITRVSAGLRTEDFIKKNIVRAYEKLTGEKIFENIYNKKNIGNINYQNPNIPEKQDNTINLWH